MSPKIMIHLDHPCCTVDVWELKDQDDEETAVRQGYVDLELVRDLVRLYRQQIGTLELLRVETLD